MNNIVKFQEKELNTYDLNGQVALSSVDLAKGLGYADESAVTRIYNRHSDEFTSDMVQTVKLTVRGLQRQIKVFSPRGCHLVAMFAKTPFAKAFRKWVLDVLDKKASDRIVEVAPHTRALPSGKKEIVLSKKAREEIGGIVKKCCAVAVREEMDHSVNGALERLFNPDPVENRNLFRFYRIIKSVLNDSFDDILCTADKKDLENRRLKKALQKANSQLQQIKESAQPIVIE